MERTCSACDYRGPGKDDYILNGTKTRITNGPEAEVFQVYAKTGGKISAFIAERGFEGFSTSCTREDGHASSMSELIFDNCRAGRKPARR